MVSVLCGGGFCVDNDGFLWVLMDFLWVLMCE